MRFPSLTELHRSELPQDEEGVTLTHTDILCTAEPFDDKCCTFCSKQCLCSEQVSQIHVMFCLSATTEY